METAPTRRIYLIARLVFIWAALIFARLIQLQVFQHPDYQKLAQSQQERVVEVRAPRGPIYDRAGQPLAMSVPVESVCVDPLRIPDLTVAAQILSKVLSLDERDLLLKLRADFQRLRGA